MLIAAVSQSKDQKIKEKSKELEFADGYSSIFCCILKLICIFLFTSLEAMAHITYFFYLKLKLSTSHRFIVKMRL